MNRATFQLAVLIALLCAFGGLSRAHSWEDLRGLTAGQQILVTGTDGREYKGAFSEVSDSAIAFQAKGAGMSLEKNQVSRVRVRSGGRRLRKILIWGGIGVAAGAVADQTLGIRLRNEGDSTNRALYYLAPAAVFAGIAGAFPSYRTIYRSR